MLNKLLKYDLKYMIKNMAIFYILSIFFSITTRILFNMEQSVIISIIGQISVGCMFSMIASTLINTMMRSWVRFRDSLYKDESYLTHTLPVKKDQIFASKVITGAVAIFTSMIVIIICLFICYYSEINMQALKGFLELAASTYNTTVLNLLLLIAVVIFLEIVYALLIGYVGIILGHKSNKNRVARSIVIGFILYLVLQTLTLGLIAFYGIFNPDVMNLINTTDIVNIEAIKSVMYAGIGIYVVYIVILYFLGKKELNKGVNVE